jgi:hypothetical protein
VPITRTVGRGSCRATLHEYEHDARILVTILGADSVTTNPHALQRLGVVVHLDDATMRDLYATLAAYYAPNGEMPADVVALMDRGEE